MDTRRLKPIHRLAQERESERARELAQRQQTLDAQEERLRELRRYAAEYAAPPAGGSMSAALLANRRAFVDKLDSAVVQQARHVERARESCEVERARLLLASRDVAVLDRLAASYQARERRSEERRSQRELDDHAVRRHRAGADE